MSAIAPQCDFCSARPVVKSYPCRDFCDEHMGIAMHSTGEFLACEGCAALVDAEENERLLDRAMRQYEPGGVRNRWLRLRVMHFHDAFRANRLTEGEAQTA